MATSIASPAPVAFHQSSPPRRRAHAAAGTTAATHLGAQLPTSASEGALATTISPLLQPPTSSKIKPFILRSTSPATATRQPQPVGSPPGANGLSRAASVPAFNSKPRSPAPPLPTVKSNRPLRRAERPVVDATTVASRPRKPASSSRWATQEDQQPPRRSSILISPSSSSNTTEQSKRSSVLGRRRPEQGVPLPSPSSSVEKGKRWLAALGGGGKDLAKTEGRSLEARRKASLGDMTNSRRQQRPSPPAVESTSPSSITSADISGSSASSATIMPLHRPPQAPFTPPRQTPSAAASLRAPGAATRKDRYGALSRSRSADGRAHPGAATTRGEEAYSSMQEMLETSGFADVRVITPTSSLRVAPPLPSSTAASAIPIPGLSLSLPSVQATHHQHPLAQAQAPPDTSASLLTSSSLAFSDSNAFGSPSSLAPPLSLAHKTSMLSLRGLFSLWKADAAVVGEVGQSPAPDQEEGEGSEEEGDSDDTIRVEQKERFVRHTREWAERVSREVASLEAPKGGRLMHQASSPALVASVEREEVAAYPPKPSPPRSTRKSSAPDVNADKRGRRRSLRHVVSSPALASHASPSTFESGYQSFALSGLALGLGGLGFPGASGETDDGAPEARWEYDDVSSNTSSSPQATRAQPRPSPTPTAGGLLAPPPPPHLHTAASTPSFWGALRTRASEAILGASGPSKTTAAGPDDSEDEVRRPPPRVIVKASSSVALRPVLSVGLQTMDWEQVVRPKKSMRGLTVPPSRR